MGGRSKKTANSHNAKHDNGVVAPGKRVAKQKSDAPLNPNQPKVPAAPTQNLTVPTHTSVSNGTAPVGSTRPSNHARHSVVKGSPSSYADDSDEHEIGEGAKMGEQQHRKIDVNTAKQPAVSRGGSSNLALTVIRSCPIGDTLAILIVLLSLPPTFLNIINFLFALLTFVPPSGQFTLLPSLTDLTSSFSPTTPSLLVLILIDFAAISIWYWLSWPSIQGILLDCAQATVATTLGGGYSLRPSTPDNIPIMIAVVCLTHLGRYRKTTLRWLHKTPLAKHLPMVDSVNDMPLRSSYTMSPERTWLQTLQIWLAIHILCQGLTRMVRRALDGGGRGSSIFTSHSKSIDPEAVSGSQGAGDGSEGSHNPPSSPSILKSKSSLQNLRDAGNKISSGKRRKKQANYVRSQQPLWAAIAATKVTVMREYEQSQATKDARGSNAEGVQNLGSAPFKEQENCIWITGIDQDKIHFETGPIPTDQAARRSSGHELEDEIDMGQSRAFYVQVNGATWASVKVLEIFDDSGEHGTGRWVGEIYGLSPASTYQVSWKRRGDGVELHSGVIITPPPPITEQASPSSTPTPQKVRPSSPASPIATLQTSIAVFDSRVTDLNNQLRRTRKDNKASTGALVKELSGLTDKLSRLANSDKSSTARQLQLNQTIRQGEEAISSLAREIESMAEVPEDLSDEWEEQKSTWERTRNEHSRVQEELERTKEEIRQIETASDADAMGVRQKKERLQSRMAKLQDQHKRLITTEMAPETRRAQSDQSSKVVENDQYEQRYRELINNLRESYHDLTKRFQSNAIQIKHLEQAAERAVKAQNAQRAQSQHENRPITPEGDLPGTNPHRQPQGPPSRYIPYGPLDLVPSVSAAGFGIAPAVPNGIARDFSGRRRSHSAISGGSIYADAEDDDEEDLIPPEYKRINGIGSMREGSDGRSSSGGSPHVSQATAFVHRIKTSSPSAGLMA